MGWSPGGFGRRRNKMANQQVKIAGQPGEPNFSAIQGWNAASVYQSAIAIIGKQIDK
jgi:membrane-bound lytic murein transglycosylase B